MPVSLTASSPGKIILFGEHAVNRQQPAIATAVDLRVFCRATTRDDEVYTFCSKPHKETCDRESLMAFKKEVDRLRSTSAFDDIRERARDFFAPARYVLAHVIERVDCPGLDIEWKSPLPIGSGLGSGAAASTAMVLASMESSGYHPKPDEIAFLAWQGDYIAHGGIASSLDSGTCAYGGLIKYTVAEGPEPLPFGMSLPLVIGDTQVQKNTATINTYVRKWLEAHPARIHLFRDIGYLVQQAVRALETGDLTTLGQLMNIHQLIQEKIGTSCREIENLIEASIGAGALGAKISGSGGGGIIIALADYDHQAKVADAIEKAGGRSMAVKAGAEGTHIEPYESWKNVFYQ